MYHSLWIFIVGFGALWIIAAVLFYIIKNDINKIYQRIDNSTVNLTNYTDNQNEIIESLSEKVTHLESYATDLERKLIALMTEIELIKPKKKK